jgi:CMP-N,N'-diacetyllegionaminic acid synthase
MILGITLARGGSTGLPRKNILPCAGKPLIAWTIDAAIKSRLLNQYVISTEDREIREISHEYGAIVIERPPMLATGVINRWDVLKYHLGQFQDATVVVLLQATSPIRQAGFIDECITEYVTKDCDSLATGFWHHDSPYPENRGMNRQEMTPHFFDDGSVYIWKRELIASCPKQEAGEHPALKVNHPLCRIDINDRYDLWMAEKVLLENPFDCLR